MESNLSTILLLIVGIIIGLGIGFCLREGDSGSTEIVFHKTYPISVTNEFGDSHTSYVEYTITHNTKTGKYQFKPKGKFVKAHHAYNDVYEHYLNLSKKSA